MRRLRSSSIKSRGAAFLALLVCLFSVPAAAQPWDGSGTEGDPYQIWDACDMQAIGADSNYWDAHFELMADIDLGGYTGTSFNIIGNDVNAFAGVFDGNDHAISNFTYSSTGIGGIGLFGCVDDPNAEIKNLGVIDPNVNAGIVNYVGSLVGYIKNGSIINCHVQGGRILGDFAIGGLVGAFSDPNGTVINCCAICRVSGRDCVGGLIGINGGDISNCYSSGSVSGGTWTGGLVGLNMQGTLSICYSENDVIGGQGVGGLVGNNGEGAISSCYAIGSVAGDSFIGGCAGISSGGILNCYSAGGVTGDNAVGGLVGNNHGSSASVSNCYSVSNVSGNNYVGGLLGYIWGNATVTNSYASGTIKGDYVTGGLVGYNLGGAISNCYSISSVLGIGRGWNVGGLVGENLSGVVSNCYSAGNVDGSAHVGGLVGYHYGGSYVKCFWDSDVNPDVNGIGSMSDPNVIDQSTANMQTASTFTDAGWDFVGEVINGPNDVWTICEGEDYPRLAWEKYGGGNGTEANPYLIRTSCQMNAIGADSNDWDAQFKLMADIDLGGYTGTQFNIIGNDVNAFTGVFDGNGHTISNFTYNSIGTDYIGLFGYVGNFGLSAEVKNVGLIDPNVYAETTIGGGIGALIGQTTDATITNCYVNGGSVSGDMGVGGLVGNMGWGTITGCYVEGSSVSGSDFSAGGLAGFAMGCDVIDCHAFTSISGNDGVGGLIGMNGNEVSATIRNCYATGNVVGVNWVGGLVGSNGFNFFTIGIISNSYARGSVVGIDRVGGLVGYNRSWAQASNCYSSGSVSADSNVGGLAGYDDGGFYTKSFWDSDVNPDVNGIGNTSDPNVIGETTAQMQTLSTFTDAGWDFVGEIINGPNDIWDICEGTNYPKFVWQIPAADFVCPDGVNFIDYAFFAEHWLQSIYGDCGEVELTGDGKVNWVDFAVFAEYWMLTGCGECGGADFTGDENVDLADLYVFATYWLGFEYAEVDLTNDGQVDLDDLREFTENWLAGI